MSIKKFKIPKVLTTLLLEASILLPIFAILGPTSATAMIAICTISVPTLPGIFYLTQKIENKINFNIQKECSQMNQKLVAVLETNEKDRRISSLTANFLPEINNKLEQSKLKLPEKTKHNINQFVYMINANYFDEINEYLPSLTRDSLIDNLIFQIMCQIEIKNQKTFTSDDIRNLLECCYFIPKNLKEKINQEFKNSKTKISKDNYEYRIIRKDFKETDFKYLEAKQEQQKERPHTFDIENIEDYHLILNGLLSHDEYYSQFGDISKLTIDLEQVKEIMIIISEKFKQELIENDPDYRNLDLVVSFINNLIIYLLVNNKTSVDTKEILHTFKEWDYITLDMKINMIDEIFANKELDYSINPYRTKEKEKVPKILKYPNK